MIPAVFVAGWLSLSSLSSSTATARKPAGDVAVVPVDLNAADIATLCTLPGIGPKKAEAIVALRKRRPLTRVTQLLQVRGIGPRILDRLRGRVTLRPSLSSPSSFVFDAERRPSGGQVDAISRPGATARP